MATGVLIIYAALAVWFGLLVRGVLRHQYKAFLLFGIGLLLYLNAGYLMNGAPAAIANFIGIYDTLNNFALPAGGAGGLAPCPEHACSVWGETFPLHSTWGVAFYDRFANGPEFRTTLLYGHIVFNSIAFVLMHVQLLRPGGTPGAGAHRWIGRTAFGSLTLGVGCAVWLASEHGPVGEYGGLFSTWGFWFMSACVYGAAIMGVLAIRSGDAVKHRVWMFRFAGSMWGAFWIFRVMLFVLDPLLRDYETAAIQICIWSSAPIGILVGELVRRRLDRAAAVEGAPAPA